MKIIKGHIHNKNTLPSSNDENGMGGIAPIEERIYKIKDKNFSPSADKQSLETIYKVYLRISELCNRFFSREIDEDTQQPISLEKINQKLKEYNVCIKTVPHIESDKDITLIMRNLFNGTIKEVHPTCAKELLSENFYKLYYKKMIFNELHNVKGYIHQEKYDLSASPIWQKCKQFKQYAVMEKALLKGLSYFGVSPDDIDKLNIHDIHQILCSQYKTSEDEKSKCMQIKLRNGGTKVHNTKRFIVENKDQFRQSLLDVRDELNRKKLRQIADEPDENERNLKITNLNQAYTDYVNTLIFGMEKYGTTDIASIIKRVENEPLRQESLIKRIREAELNHQNTDELCKELQESKNNIKEYIGFKNYEDYMLKRKYAVFPRINVHHKNPNDKCELMLLEGKSIEDNNDYSNTCFMIEGPQICGTKFIGTHDFMHILETFEMKKLVDEYIKNTDSRYDFIITPNNPDTICMLSHNQYFTTSNSNAPKQFTEQNSVSVSTQRRIDAANADLQQSNIAPQKISNYNRINNYKRA